MSISKFSPEFKMEAVKRVETSHLPIARVAVELGLNENTTSRLDQTL